MWRARSCGHGCAFADERKPSSSGPRACAVHAETRSRALGRQLWWHRVGRNPSAQGGHVGSDSQSAHFAGARHDVTRSERFGKRVRERHARGALAIEGASCRWDRPHGERHVLRRVGHSGLRIRRCGSRCAADPRHEHAQLTRGGSRLEAWLILPLGSSPTGRAQHGRAGRRGAPRDSHIGFGHRSARSEPDHEGTTDEGSRRLHHASWTDARSEKFQQDRCRLPAQIAGAPKARLAGQGP